MSGDERTALRTSIPGVGLRPLGGPDADALRSLLDANRDHLGRFDDDFGQEQHVEDLRASLATQTADEYFFAIVRDETILGRMDLARVGPDQFVFGYWLDAGETGKGVVTAAGASVLAYAETLGAVEVYAGVSIGNEASERVLRRLGFVLVQTLDDRTRWRRCFVDPAPPPEML